MPKHPKGEPLLLVADRVKCRKTGKIFQVVEYQPEVEGIRESRYKLKQINTHERRYDLVARSQIRRFYTLNFRENV